MSTSATSRVLAIIGIAAVFLASCGDRKKAEFEAKAAQNVTAATEQLRSGLAIPAGSADAAQQIKNRVDAVAALFDVVRSPDVKRSPAVADAAEIYLVDTQAILHLRNRVVTLRNAAQASAQALVAHMRVSGARSVEWVRTAPTLQRRAEYDNVDYRRALASYADLLQKHRDAQKRLRAVLPAAPLVEDAQIQQALQEVQAAERQALADVEALRKTAPAR